MTKNNILVIYGEYLYSLAIKEGLIHELTEEQKKIWMANALTGISSDKAAAELGLNNFS